MIYAGNAQSLNGLARDVLAHGTLYQSCHSRCSCVGFFPSRSCRLSFPANKLLIISAKHIDICINFYSYSRIGTNENNMKIKMWTLLWAIIRKARNHCQDVDNCGDEDHCQYHLGIDHCQTGNHCQDREHCPNGIKHADR